MVTALHATLTLTVYCIHTAHISNEKENIDRKPMKKYRAEVAWRGLGQLIIKYTGSIRNQYHGVTGPDE
jgi:hypothetical protein